MRSSCCNSDVDHLEDSNKDQDIEIIRNFAEDTSFHGCKYAVKRKSRLRRAWWGILFGAMTVGLLAVLVQLILNVLDFPVVTRNSVEYLTTMEFPTIMFCNTNGYNRSKADRPEDLNEYLVTLNPVISGMLDLDIPSSSPYINVTMDNLFYKLSMEKDKHIVLAKFGGKKLGLDYFDETHGLTGVCFQFNSEALIQQNGIRKVTVAGPSGALEVVADIHQDVYFAGPHNEAALQVYIHHPSHQYTILDHAINVLPGTTTLISLTMRKYKFLPPPYRSFGNDPCVETNTHGFRNPLKYAPEYSWTACLNECYSNQTDRHCGCQAALDRKNVHVSYCTMGTFYTCAMMYVEKVFLNQTSQRELCGACLKRCTFYAYDTEVTQGLFPSDASAEFMVKKNIIKSKEYARNNMMHIKIFYERLLLNTIEHEAEYTLNSIVGVIGGQMGFFLGASVITLCELAEVFLCYVKTLLNSYKRCPESQVKHPVQGSN